MGGCSSICKAQWPRSLMLIHGHTRGSKPTPTFVTWSAMFARCNNPKVPSYQYYGAKSIKVCARWRQFANFLKDMGERPKGKSIHRLSNAKGYKPGNCCWATPTEQNQYSGNCRWLEANGQRKLITRWAEGLGVSVSCVHGRLKRGWSVLRAVTEKPRERLKVRCRICGKVTNQRFTGQRVCGSETCFKAAKRLPTMAEKAHCVYCFKQFVRRTYNGRFCSRRCSRKMGGY